MNPIKVFLWVEWGKQRWACVGKMLLLFLLSLFLFPFVFSYLCSSKIPSHICKARSLKTVINPSRVFIVVKCAPIINRSRFVTHSGVCWLDLVKPYVDVGSLIILLIIMNSFLTSFHLLCWLSSTGLCWLGAFYHVGLQTKDRWHSNGLNVCRLSGWFVVIIAVKLSSSWVSTCPRASDAYSKCTGRVLVF